MQDVGRVEDKMVIAIHQPEHLYKSIRLISGEEEI